MEDGVTIEILGDSTGGRSSEDDISEDDVLILGVSSNQRNNDDLPRKEDGGQKDGVLPSPQSVYRSYFEVLDNNDQPVHELVLQPVKEKHPPITLTSATKYLKWTIRAPTPAVKRTHYDVVLGISIGNLNLEAVEAIIITIQHKVTDDSTAKSEVITPKELKRLCSDGVLNDADRASTSGDESSKSCRITTMAPDDPCFRWKLHEKLISLGDDPVQLVLEFKTWEGESTDYGSIKLHYTEILTKSQAFYKNDLMYREHQPFIHTIDLNRTKFPQLDADPEGPKRITDYIISGNASHILVITVAGDYRFLQLWNICQFLYPEVSTLSKSSQPRLVAWMQLPIANGIAYDYCLSWDGAQFVCIDLGGPDGGSDKKETEKEEGKKRLTCREAPKQNTTAFYQVSEYYTEVSAGVIAGSGYWRYNVEEICPILKGLSAKAAFHDFEFVTCDGVTIEVYEPYNLWKPRRSIVMDPTQNAPKLATNVSNALRNNLRGSYLVIRDRGAHQVSTWDIKRGIRLSSYTNLTYEQMENVNDCAAVSKDGNLIAIPDKHQVDIFLTATWTLVAHYSFQGMEHNPSTRAVRFICNEKIMVALDYKHLPFYQRNRGFILDAKRVSLVEEYIAEGCDTFWMATDTWTGPSAICIGVSQLSFFKLEDRTVLSPMRLKERCGKSCRSTGSLQDQEITEATAPSGLYFKAERSTAPVVIHGRQEYLPVLVVTVSDKNDQPIERLSISLPKSLCYNSATFVNGCSHLLISLDKLVMVWRTPTSPQDTFTLQLVLAVNDPTKWKVCPHRQLYGLRQEQPVSDGTNLDDPIYGAGDEFMDGIALLPLIFGNANNVVQQQIILYIGNNMNNSHAGACYRGAVVRHVCFNWKVNTHRSTVQLWRALLAHPTVRWIPMHYEDRISNPLLLILDKAVENAEAFELAEVLIDYCVHRAKLEKDPLFLLPILQCLQELADPKMPYSEATLKLLRDLAYLPARDREAIINQHWIAHPFELHWRFWRPNPGGLDQYKDQVLKVTSVHTVNRPENSFSREIYLATFDMLWLRSDPDARVEEIWEDATIYSCTFFVILITAVLFLALLPALLLRWIIYCGSGSGSLSKQLKGIFDRVLVFPGVLIYHSLRCLQIPTAMIVRRLNITPHSKVECHPFELAALDNPAIAALVEYKWNTIGLQYWLLRFLAQCVYYALVLVGVFMQIYSYNDEPTMKGIFTAIVAMAASFLGLELMQIINHRYSYFQSVYNYVDLLAFLTPSIAIILQLNSSDFGAQNSLLSFSVLFIFLHFLFELRVIRNVCKFVSIIIHAISSIQVFFFVFAGGILAFAIAILHLLHKCTEDTCPSYNKTFSFNLFRAVSMTYFMMSGRYDSVSDGLSNDDFGIHIMLMMFFFFTVIVMMNVLIALINHAFDDGDKTWELDWLQNRMRYVESAQNMEFDISGAFKLRTDFPETIYYTATALQVREYKKTTERLKEENSPTADVTANASAESQTLVSEIFGGDNQDWLQSKQQKQEEVDANTGENSAMTEMLHFQEQRRMRKEQMEAWSEQQEVNKALLAAAEELREELALLKKQRQQ